MFFATGDGKESEPSSSSVQGSQPCHHFELLEVQLATENFNESLVIGKGGFGKVYKGNIVNGSSIVEAAIKRLDSMSSQGAAEFWTEVETLSMLRHCNLVSLFGYCNHGKEMILIYEYMPNGTLEDHLHKLSTSLSWLQRLKICIDVVRGLHYLHTGTGIEIGVIHRDVKSSNILLHESWAAKIADFGLSKIGPTNQPSTYVETVVKGTFGYLDPDYYATGKLTRKSDVYAFGVVLLEVLCRKRAVDSSLDEEQWNLARWVQECIKEGNLKHIIDSDIRGQISPKCLKEFVRVAERCLHSNPKQRPTMAEALVSLESALILQEKFNNSLEGAGKTIFGRIVDMLPLSSNGENSDKSDSKLSSDCKPISTVLADKTVLPETREISAASNSPILMVFQLADLKKATRNFSGDLCIGEGNFGEVFLGWLDRNTYAPSKRGDGFAVAVIRRKQLFGLAEWQVQLSFLIRLRHPNIISLLGYCSNEHDDLLVYEYMPRKSLNRVLFTDIAEPLSWGTRLKIMIGVARGLTYLYSSEVQVMCPDLKSSNILLDEDFNSKLADFSLVKSITENGETRVCTRIVGTSGYYIDPTYIATGRVKSHIYAFGVVLLETLTGLNVWDSKRPVEKQNLVDWARPSLESRKKLKKIMDPRLEQNYPLEGAFRCAALTLRCLEYFPKVRPSSEEVLQSLEQIYSAIK